MGHRPSACGTLRDANHACWAPPPTWRSNANRRWAIENETFKTLKDRDIYNFEHNYGHGKKNLAVVLPMLAMLSLLIDQTQQHCCSLVQKALKYQKRKLYFWEKMNRLFLEYRIRDWRTFYLAMSRRINKPELADMFPTGP